MVQKNLLFSKIISYLFHPIFMPTMGLIYLYCSGNVSGFNAYSSPSDQWVNLQVFGLIFLFTFLVPLFTAIELKKFGKISSIQMQYKEERILPFTITGLSVFTSYYLIYNYLMLPVNPVLQVFMLGCLVSIVISLGITLKWKISAHMIGIGGFAGMIFLLSSVLGKVLLLDLVGIILVSGLVAYSRLNLNAHSMAQVIAGFVLGFACETFFLFFT